VQKEEMPTSTRRAGHYCGLEGLPDVPKLCLTERDKTNPNVTERNAWILQAVASAEEDGV